MTPADLRAWQTAMCYTPAHAAQALGINLATYYRLISDSDKPKEIDRRTALACSAIAAGLAEWPK